LRIILNFIFSLHFSLYVIAIILITLLVPSATVCNILLVEGT